MKLSSSVLRSKFLEFFKERDHALIPPASLIPENDPTVLFTTAGMHPLVPFLLGQKHPSGKRLANAQPCIRTGDIDEVGDTIHHTFFEMLGNWSLGAYFKKESIAWSYEFLTKELQIDSSFLAVTCFQGDENAPQDTTSENIWQLVGIKNIVFMSKEHNWWGPAGQTGPCGPDTEIFYYVGEGKSKGNPKTRPEEWVEIWNNVFMEYNKTKEGNYEPLQQKNVDTGMGLERTTAILNGLTDNYRTDVFLPIIKELESISGKVYGKDLALTRSMRIVADHMKAATFILGDPKGISPSNVGQGYILRRLIRRAIRHARLLGIEGNFCVDLANVVITLYKDIYDFLDCNKDFIFSELIKEEEKFQQLLQQGLLRFSKIAGHTSKTISGHDAFLLFTSYGFPLEMTKELAMERGLQVNEKEYGEKFAKHQELSRTATAGIFKSGLADTSEETMKLHTASHILLKALREILGEQVEQKGSNITSERLRFDFNFERKLTPEELKKIEDRVNQIIEEDHQVIRHETTYEDAKKKGAIGFFDHKYGARVSYYEIVNYSKELCTGPHVEHTGILGHFKIIKEESSSSGIRRIKAILK